jgi:hypothetical protein
MRTPAGKECRYFYGDYYRGRQREECRLLNAANPPERWTRELCFSCPVPDLIAANACSHMVLEGQLERPFPFIKQRVKAKAYCTKTLRDVPEPHIGCGECHPLPQIFTGKPRDPDAAA